MLTMEQYKVTVVCDKEMKAARHQFKMTFLRSTTFISRSIPMNPKEKTRSITVHGKPCLVIGQTHVDRDNYYAGKERKDHMKTLETDTFLVLFPVKSRKMFGEVKTQLIPKIRSYYPQKPIIIVATEIECRADDSLTDTVSSDEVHKMALKMGTSYWETSAKRNFGVNECFQHAVELAILNKGLEQEVKGWFVRNKTSVIIPPLRPPSTDPEPIIKALPSTFVEDWLQTLSDPKFHDIRFILGPRQFLAHKAVLCSASSFFRKMLLPIDTANDSANKCYLSGDKVIGIHNIYDTQDGKETVVDMSSDIKPKTFIKMLEKMYTDVLSTSTKFDFWKFVSSIHQVFNNQKSSKVSDEKNNSMRELLNEEIFSDMDFIVKGNKVAAHKVVVCTRCPEMAAMEESRFVEGESRTEIPISDVSLENFKIFLEFLYTDQVQLDDSSKVIGVLSLAHKYGAQRLVTLCELHLKKELENVFWHELHMVEEDLLNAAELLIRYKACHAMQMVEWCRYYISQNYSKYCEREGLSLLDCEDREYVQQHRWPPLSFENEMEEFWRQIPLDNKIA